MDVGPDGVNTDNADKKEKKSWYRFTQKVEFTSTALILTCIKLKFCLHREPIFLYVFGFICVKSLVNNWFISMAFCSGFFERYFFERPIFFAIILE